MLLCGKTLPDWRESISQQSQMLGKILGGYAMLGRQTLTDVFTQSLSSKPGVSITVSSKPCALRLMACGLAVSCWKDVTCATDSLKSEFAVELFPIMLLPA